MRSDCGQQVGVDIADSQPHQLALFDESKNRLIGDYRQLREPLHQRQQVGPVLQVSTRQFSNYERVGQKVIGEQQVG